MTAKNKDSKNRWRDVTIGFRVSEAEAKHIDDLTKISGMTKQDYILARLHDEDIVIVAGSRTFVTLKNMLGDIGDRLEAMTKEKGLQYETIHEDLSLVCGVLSQMKLEGAEAPAPTIHRYYL